MNNKYILLMALDTLLLEMDDDYEELSEEQHNLVYTKVLEDYGLTIHSEKEEIDEMKAQILQDVYKYRDQLMKEIQ